MKSRKTIWVALISLAFVLIAAVGVHRFFERNHFEPGQHLALVEHAEQTAEDSSDLQMLATHLAILGRDHEVRTLDCHPQFEEPPSVVPAREIELNIVPWKEGLKNIAANHRLVMIMEHHFFSKHREFIGASLPIFRDAGFTHYAAEAISQLESGLAARGYPSKYTGYYTDDPQFGNVIRKALGLRFEVLGYDFRFTTHEEREEYAASRLAKLLQKQSQAKLVVHAGHAHVLKHPTDIKQRWLASLLWEKTGIEPFTVWQWSRGHGAEDYEKIIDELKIQGVSLSEPVFLMPPPAFDSGLRDSPYRSAPVDAIVIHPPDQSVAPNQRTVLFPNAMQRLVGRWNASTWPVVISVYKKGEPTSAVPLDQVMLRQNEAEFVLWIPEGTEYTIRVFDHDGLIASHARHDGDILLIDISETGH